MILYVTFEPTEHDLYNLHDLQISHTKLNLAQYGALRILIAQNLLRPVFIILAPVEFPDSMPMSQNMQGRMLDQWRWQAHSYQTAMATIALLLFITCSSELF